MIKLNIMGMICIYQHVCTSVKLIMCTNALVDLWTVQLCELQNLLLNIRFPTFGSSYFEYE